MLPNWNYIEFHLNAQKKNSTVLQHTLLVILCCLLGRVTIEGGGDDDEDSHSHSHGENSDEDGDEDSRSGTDGRGGGDTHTNTPDVVIDLSPCEYVQEYVYTCIYTYIGNIHMLTNQNIF